MNSKLEDIFGGFLNKDVKKPTQPTENMTTEQLLRNMEQNAKIVEEKRK